MRKKIFSVVIMACFLCLCFAGCNKDGAKVYFQEWSFDGLKREDATIREGDARIMSANVLVHIKNGYGGEPVAPRAQMFGEVTKHYLPDVIGLQEFCECWYKELPQHLPDYKIFDTKKSQYTTMMYNTKTVKLVENGSAKYSKQSNAHCRFVVWGVFEKIDTHEKFIVTTTHWDFGTEAKKLEMLAVQAQELADKIKELETKYPDAPVFATGDYNAYEFSENDGAQFYNSFIKKSNMSDCKFIKDINIRSTEGVDIEHELWDHIFTNKKENISLFGILQNEFYLDMTDHPLIFVDAKI